MKLIIFLIALGSPLGLLSQIETIQPEELSIKFDSVDISIWNIYFKELSLSEEETAPPSRMLAQYTLTQTEAKDLLDHLKSDHSYSGERANLSHHDIEINFYLNGKTTLILEISAMTGNITIYSQISDYSFRNNSSKTFGQFLLSILENGKLLEIAEYDEIDVEGLAN